MVERGDDVEHAERRIEQSRGQSRMDGKRQRALREEATQEERVLPERLQDGGERVGVADSRKAGDRDDRAAQEPRDHDHPQQARVEFKDELDHRRASDPECARDEGTPAAPAGEDQREREAEEERVKEHADEHPCRPVPALADLREGLRERERHRAAEVLV